MKTLAHTVAVLAIAAWGSGALAQPTTVMVTPTATDIQVQPDPVRFTGRGNVVIRFELPKGSGYRFPANGIVIETEVVSETDLRPGGAGRGQKEVGPCQRIENGMAVNCPNRNTRVGTYKYTVNLLDPAGKPVPPKDPVIVNQ